MFIGIHHPTRRSGFEESPFSELIQGIRHPSQKGSYDRSGNHITRIMCTKVYARINGKYRPGIHDPSHPVIMAPEQRRQEEGERETVAGMRRYETVLPAAPFNGMHGKGQGWFMTRPQPLKNLLKSVNGNLVRLTF